MRSIFAFACAGAVVICLGCGGGEPSPAPGQPTPTPTPTPTPQGPTVATVTVTPPTPTITARQRLLLTATAASATGAPVTGAVSWSSSDTLVALVSSTGVVTAISEGQATITATQDGKSGSASLTVRRGDLAIKGVWTMFERRGANGGIFNGELLKLFDSTDATLGTKISAEAAQEMDLMRSFGINAISFQVIGTDSVAGNVLPPVCAVNPVLGARWPQPTPTELSNLVKLLDLAQQKGIRVLLNLSHTHFEESPPTNATTWLTAILNAVKSHPALELVTFMGDVHVHNDASPSCGLPAEPPLWLGPPSTVYQHLKFEMALARTLGVDRRRVSAEAIVGDYNVESQAAAFAGSANTNHLYSPIATLKQMFDELAWPDSLRTYSLSFYQRKKCGVGAPPNCVEATPAAWADQMMRYVSTTIGPASGARAIAIEYGVYPDGASTPEESVTNITNVMRRYGMDGGSYWTWVETDNAYEATLPFAEAVLKRAATFQFNPVKDALVKAYTQP